MALSRTPKVIPAVAEQSYDQIKLTELSLDENELHATFATTDGDVVLHSGSYRLEFTDLSDIAQFPRLENAITRLTLALEKHYTYRHILKEIRDTRRGGGDTTALETELRAAKTAVEAPTGGPNG